MCSIGTFRLAYMKYFTVRVMINAGSSLMISKMASSERESSEEETKYKDNKNDGGEFGEPEENNGVQGNPGWADAMARILTKQLPDDKPAVLIKYKKAQREKKEKLKESAKQKMISQERHQTREQNHVKPAPSNDEKERMLKRIATRGVVKLFNAVYKHQKELDAKLKTAPTEAKKAKVLKSVSKSSFLDMLKSNSNETVQPANDGSANDEKTSKWNILRDDFMMGGKMKDWDKDNDDMDYEDDNQTVGTDEESD